MTSVSSSEQSYPLINNETIQSSLQELQPNAPTLLSFQTREWPVESTSCCKIIYDIAYVILSVVTLGLVPLIRWAIREWSVPFFLSSSQYPEMMRDAVKDKPDRYYECSIEKLHVLKNNLLTALQDDLLDQQTKDVFEDLSRALEALPAQNAGLDVLKSFVSTVADRLAAALHNLPIEDVREILRSRASYSYTACEMNSPQERTQNIYSILSLYYRSFLISQELFDVKRTLLLTDPNVSRISVQTPDGAQLDGIFIQRNREPDALTLIRCEGMGECYEETYDQIDQMYDMKDESGNLLNLILFNYRGVNRSQGKITPETPPLDAFFIAQFAQQGLHIDKSRTITHGFSLGGGPAAYAASQYQDADCPLSGMHSWNDRSYFTLPDAAEGRFSNCCMKKIAKLFAIFAGWNWDTQEWWGKIQANKWISYHPNDSDIPFEATLANHYITNPTLQGFGAIIPLSADNDGDETPHMRPLKNAEKDLIEEQIRRVQEGLVNNPISQTLANFNNSNVQGQVYGIYITTNETNLAEVQQVFSEHPRPNDEVQTIHIGCAAWYNLDIMSARKSTYGLIVDFNPKNADFIRTTLELVNSCESREAFTEAMISHLNSLEGTERELFFHSDQHGLPTERVALELSREGSWLQSDENYLYIKEQLASNGRLIAITEDITNVEKFASIRRFLDRNNIVIDTLYVSNMCNFMNTSQKKNSFENSMRQLLNRDTIFINCPTLNQGASHSIRLHQRPILGRKILKQSYNTMQLFEESISIA